MARKVSRKRTKARRAKPSATTVALNALMAAGHSAAQHRKGRSVSSDLAAPMTGEIERQLEQLIARFGYEKVRDALAPLMAKCSFRDWLCVANAVDRLAQRAESQAGKKRLTDISRRRKRRRA
jgi:hypothetical protein